MNTERIEILGIMFTVLAMAGCATPYQRTGFTGGFSETRLQENAFSVSFRGNGYTSRERSTDFAMLRCAELTLENGFRFFVIADSAQDTKTAYYKTGGHSGSTIVPIHKPRSSYTIFCFRDKPEGAMAFDADFLATSIRQKYGMQTPQQSAGGYGSPAEGSPYLPANSASGP